MYRDIICNSRILNDNDVREALFTGIKQNINGIVLLPNFVQSTKDFVPAGMDISCLVDYPYGASETSVRSHAALAAIRKGANTLDLVVNSSLIFNSQRGKFYDDIEAILNLCKEHDTTLRLVFEYRLFEYQDLINICNVVREMGIEYVTPSTSSQMDSWDDNLAISVALTTKCSINVIMNGKTATQKQYDMARATKVFGIRFANHNVLSEFGV